jgi:hypothetical protein
MPDFEKLPRMTRAQAQRVGEIRRRGAAVMNVKLRGKRVSVSTNRGEILINKDGSVASQTGPGPMRRAYT